MRAYGICAVVLGVAVLIGWLAPSCVYDPTYEGTHCGPGASCPSGYSCDPVAKVCTKSPIDEPDPGEPDPDGGDDGGLDGGDDGGVDAADEGGDDGGVDAADEGGDESGDESGDQDPCGGCARGQWCDEGSGQCQACNDPTHCGEDCLECQAGETCNNLGVDGFCCQPACEYATACTRLDCNGNTWLCKAGFNPLTYAWVDLASAGSMFCALADTDGIVAEHYACDPQNADRLRYWCPWGGTCHEDGTCKPDATYALSHDCGALYGCDADHCRMHRKVGQACEFNFDCDSFCCSRDASPLCLDRSNPDLCKISDAFYRENFTDYTWHTRPQDAGADPHDIDQWWWEGGDHATECSVDADCDTGDCHDFTMGPVRCRLPGCLSDTEAATIKAQYFCDSAELGHQAHINVVTNQAPWPDTPGSCVYEE